MARPLRPEYPGGVYHITSRGNARENIFVDNADRERCLSVLGDAVAKYNRLCHAYCLMDNHYHALIETPDPTLCMGMRQLNGVYTQAFNRRHRRVGHVFQERYKSILVEKEAHLLELCRYVALNPVRAGLVNDPGKWQWSSAKTSLLTSLRETESARLQPTPDASLPDQGVRWVSSPGHRLACINFSA